MCKCVRVLRACVYVAEVGVGLKSQSYAAGGPAKRRAACSECTEFSQSAQC